MTARQDEKHHKKVHNVVQQGWESVYSDSNTACNSRAAPAPPHRVLK